MSPKATQATCTLSCARARAAFLGTRGGALLPSRPVDWQGFPRNFSGRSLAGPPPSPTPGRPPGWLHGPFALGDPPLSCIRTFVGSCSLCPKPSASPFPLSRPFPARPRPPHANQHLPEKPASEHRLGRGGVPVWPSCSWGLAGAAGSPCASDTAGRSGPLRAVPGHGAAGEFAGGGAPWLGGPWVPVSHLHHCAALGFRNTPGLLAEDRNVQGTGH